MNGLLSVIVPVYNTEKYLKNCIQSILNQTYKNIEVIIVDNASKDQSLNICRQFEKSDNRVKVYALKENSGVVAAYTYGVSVSTGDLIAFVDSDDTIEKDMFLKLLDLMNKFGSDISACALSIVIDEKNIIKPCLFGDEPYSVCYSKNEIKGFIESNENNPFDDAIQAYRWNKIYKKNLFSKCLKYTNKSFSMFEDNCIVLPCLLSANKVAYINEPLYNYYWYNADDRKNIMTSFDASLLEQIPEWLNVQERIINDFALNKDNLENAKIIYSYALDLILRNKKRKDYLRILRNKIDNLHGFFDYICKNYSWKKQLIYFLLFKYRLYNLLCLVDWMYKKIRNISI